MKRLRVIHECQDEASDMFYCSGLGSKSDLEGTGLIDWYAHEDCLDEGEGDTVSAILYCPFCGIKLPDTIPDAVGDTFRIEEFEEQA